jgi:hypothetical protein
MLTDASVEFIALVAQPGDMMLDGRVSVSKTEAALGRSGPGELLALSHEIRVGDRLEPCVEWFRQFRARPAWTQTKSGGSDQQKRKRPPSQGALQGPTRRGKKRCRCRLCTQASLPCLSDT